VAGDPTRLALFDLDNTLVDRSAAFRRWAVEFVAEHALADDALEGLVTLDHDGLATREAVFSGARHAFGLTESIAELEAAYRRSYPRQFRPDAAVLDGLAALRAAGWRVVVVTNGPSSQIEKIRRCGLDAVVDGWCISEEIGAEKPDAAIFLAAAALVAQPLAGYMVGDQTETDILGGKRVGLTTVLLARGRTFPPDATTPDAVVDDVLAAIALVAGDSPTATR
jgi:putative hydrolase of the HAD superfamily